ncbi:MAG: YhjD/YihY/BrkB family envelope integrity protein, partial [Phycisphaerales bacterium]|nr:YhjD/YihY/BrkB family envelope integrity protein [Phycisphaerales bacterium]
MPTPTPEPESKPSLRQRLQKLIQFLESMPRTELTRGQRMLKFSQQLWVTGYQQLRQDRAGSNAAALTFRTLFSMLPILILAALLTKAVISESTFLQSIAELMEWLHMDEIRLTMAKDDGTQTIVLEQWVSNMAKQVMDSNLSGLTWIGIIVVLYSAVRLIEEVDSTFNFITRSSPEGWIRRRIWVYLGVLLLAPIVTIAAGLGLDWCVRELGASIHAWPWVVPTAQACITLALVWWLLRLCYRMIPARAIRKRPATLGAASATVLLV